MIDKARENSKRLEYDNVEFRLGDIEDLPIEDNSVDVVLSNCVLNLLPSKDRIFHEIFRVTEAGRTFLHIGCSDYRYRSASTPFCSRNVRGNA